jgi:hypothetical protein
MMLQVWDGKQVPGPWAVSERGREEGPVEFGRGVAVDIYGVVMRMRAARMVPATEAKILKRTMVVRALK